MKLKLNLEYGSIFASYWMLYGVTASFCATFLLERGFSNSEIGVLMAVASAFSVLIQPLLGDWADRSKKLNVMGVSEIVGLLLLVLVSLLFVFVNKSPALWVVFILILAWHMALQPLFNSLCFKLEETGHHINYGMCRGVGGSLGYAVLVAILGTLVENGGVVIIPISGIVMTAIMILALFVTNRSYKKAMKEKVLTGKKGEELTGKKGEEQQTAASENQIDQSIEKLSDVPIEKLETVEDEEINLVEFIKRNRLFVFLCVSVVILYFQNSITNNFMLQIVEGVGGNAEDMGRIFSVMAMAEIPGMLAFDRLNKKFGTIKLLVFSASMFVMKIFIMWVAPSVSLLYVSQLFNMVSFALFLPSIVAFTNEIMKRGEAVKGQALFTAATAVSGIFASVLGGIILDASGSKFMLTISLVCTLVGVILVSYIALMIKRKA